MKITVLAYVEDETNPEYDVVVEQVAQALRSSGHTVSLLGIRDDLSRLVATLRRRSPDLVFNLMEMFGNNLLGASLVAGLLELLGVAYTGCGPGEFYLQEDKALTKKLLAFDRVLYPDFAVFSSDADLETGGQLRLPLFVKPLRMDASIGIGAKSLVHSVKDMMRQVLQINEKVGDSALVEEYIEGREFFVGVLGNQEPLALPPIEMDYSGMPEGRPHVLDAKAKWDEKSAEYKGTRAVLAEVSDELRAKLQEVALAAYRALRVRDYGRIDLRLTEAGEIYVIEVNASCYLEQSSEFATAASAAGLEYLALVQRIVELALARRQAPPPVKAQANGQRKKRSRSGNGSRRKPKATANKKA